MGVLIEADELADVLTGEQRPLVIDVRWTLGGPDRYPDYLQGHIPGAVWVDLESDLTDPEHAEPGPGGRHPLPDPAAFQAAMRRLGMDDDTDVVIYDDANALAASRLWWLLCDGGKRGVRVLNGGHVAWVAGGHRTEAGPVAEPDPGGVELHPGQLPQVHGSELAEMISSGSAPVIIDVRGAERYTGESEPIDPVAGHIPGAINIESMITVEEDGRFRSAAAIAEAYADVADGSPRPPIAYCGSGITAAHTALARAVAELPQTTIYPGSWSDWITDPQRPVATGDRP